MPSISWNRMRAAHLFRRAAFGATAEELDRSLAEGREATVDRLLNFEDIPTYPLDNLLSTQGFNFTAFYAVDDPRLARQFISLQRWWYLRMVYSPRPFQEKLTLFWHNHFPTSFAKIPYVPLLYRQNELFRRLGAYQFENLLLAVARDPAMLAYLDNNT